MARIAVPANSTLQPPSSSSAPNGGPADEAEVLHHPRGGEGLLAPLGRHEVGEDGLVGGDAERLDRAADHHQGRAR